MSHSCDAVPWLTDRRTGAYSPYIFAPVVLKSSVGKLAQLLEKLAA